MAIKAPVLINVKIRGVNRVQARLNRIIANIPRELDGGSRTLITRAKDEAKELIIQNTRGTGNLANSMQVRIKRSGRNNNYSLGFPSDTDKYAKYVHDSFSPHWVHRDMIKEWLALHSDVKLKRGKWLFVGGPNAAPWIKGGGVKFFDKAFQSILRLSEKEYRDRLNKIMK